MNDAREIQKEIDAAGRKGGGKVTIPAGTYWLHDSLHLRAGVHLVGQGEVILKKTPSLQSRVADFLGYGFYEFTVTEPDKFEIGMGVHLTDNKSGGFYDTVATIVGRRGDAFYIYLPYDEGVVSSIYPLLEGTAVRNVRVENLILDGNPEETRWLNGCRGGGIFLIRSRDAEIAGVEVRNYRGDGISFQQCARVRVETCHVHHNSGSGLHPGSGSVIYRFLKNRVEDNGGCGLFYCLRTTHSLCEGNRFERNAQPGISVGERDTDHVIRGNVILDNRQEGIDFRKIIAHGGDRTRIEDNTLRGNGADGDRYEIRIPDKLQDVCILRNRIEPSHGKAISVGSDCRNIVFAENSVLKRAQTSQDIAGARDSVRQTLPDALPIYGPDALDFATVQHLRWREG